MNRFMRYPVCRNRARIFFSFVLLSLLCGAAGIVKIGPTAWRFAARHFQLSRARHQWKAVLAGNEVCGDAPVCCLRIPAVGIDLPVLGEATEKALSRLPCISRVCADSVRSPVIVAHRDQHFRPLRDLSEGDRVYITRRSGERVEYRVLELRVVPPDIAESLARSAQPGTLMLVTCYPFCYVGSAPERFVVVCIRC